MASPVQATLILCDAAQVDPLGKLHLLGGGWSVTGTPTTSAAVAILFKIPWDRANERLTVKLTLVSEDGAPVVIPDQQS